MADNIADGGPAFPHLRPLARWTEDGPEMVKENMGMSLRDWFAGQALCKASLELTPYNSELDEIAVLAYRLADAMLKAREVR